MNFLKKRIEKRISNRACNQPSDIKWLREEYERLIAKGDDVKEATDWLEQATDGSSGGSMS